MSTPAHYLLPRTANAMVEIMWQYSPSKHSPAPWLLTLGPVSENSLHRYLQSRAVVDDFGTLVTVEQWQ